MNVKLPQLLTADDVAELAQVHHQTVLRYAREGVLPSVRIGGSIRFDPVVIEQLLASSRVAKPRGGR